MDRYLNHAKNAFRVLMVLLILASLYSSFSQLRMIFERGRFGQMPPTVFFPFVIASVYQLLQTVAFWVPAEVLFDVHKRIK